MLDKLIEQAALVLVIVPGNNQSKEVVDAITNSLGKSNQSFGGSSTQAKIDAETVAVITAAASHVIGQAFQIKKIQFIKEQKDSSWSRIGKLNVFASHDIKRY